MSSSGSTNESDLFALELEAASPSERASGIKLLHFFETVDGFWQACVRMVTPSSTDLSSQDPENEQSTQIYSSPEQVLRNGIRDNHGELTVTFCEWFDRHCCYDQLIRSRPFLKPYTRPAEFFELPQVQPEATNSENRSNAATQSGNRNPSQQLQTKFARAVIERMNPQLNAKANEIYPDFTRWACQVADDEAWGQELTAEIELGTGYLVISYITIGRANRAKKTITAKRLRDLLAERRNRQS